MRSWHTEHRRVLRIADLGTQNVYLCAPSESLVPNHHQRTEVVIFSDYQRRLLTSREAAIIVIYRLYGRIHRVLCGDTPLRCSTYRIAELASLAQAVCHRTTGFRLRHRNAGRAIERGLKCRTSGFWQIDPLGDDLSTMSE
jgi:hypothetical protein